MGSDWLQPWTTEPCDLCDCEHMLTRTRGRPRRDAELCEGCQQHAEGYTLGLAQGAAAERARIVAALDAAWREANTIEGYGHMGKPITDFGRGLEAAAAIVESMPEQGGEEWSDGLDDL